MADLSWPTVADDRLRTEVHSLVCAVVDLGGAIGWLTRPPRPETDGWLEDLLGRGDLLCCSWDQDGLTAMGSLAARSGVFSRMVDLQKLMAHPRARGRGLARAVATALIERADADGRESIRLGVRGNNAGAIALYASLGFLERGRFPNAIAVGEERYDDVWMSRTLGYPEGVVLRGSGPGGPGS